MDKHEINKWRMRMEGRNSPGVPRISAANTDFVSSADLDDLYDLSVLTAEENGWECDTREEFERRYREEVAERNSKVSER
jgi:hypothetical protein